MRKIESLGFEHFQQCSVTTAYADTTNYRTKVMQCTYLNVNFAFPVDKGPVIFKIVFFVGSHNIRQKITLRWKQHSNWKLQVPPSNLLKQDPTTLNRNFSLLNVLVLGNKAFNVIGLVITCLKLANESVCTDIFTRLVWKLANQG